MNKNSERYSLLKKLRERFIEAGRDDVPKMSDKQFYRFLLRAERQQRQFQEPRKPIEYLGQLLFSINRQNARRVAYANGNPNWKRA